MSYADEKIADVYDSMGNLLLAKINIQPRPQSSLASFEVTSAEKLVGRNRARSQAFSCYSDSGNWPGDEADKHILSYFSQQFFGPFLIREKCFNISFLELLWSLFLGFKDCPGKFSIESMMNKKV